MSDQNYDILIDVIKEKEIDGYQNPVGSTVKQNHEHKLPYYLGSMNKCRDQKEVDRWVQKYKGETNYVIEDKLDGVSCLMIIHPENVINLYTRGDGLIGTDISHFSKLIKNQPIKQEKSIAIRGELIMKKSIFDLKYKDKFANARNLISGIINSKTIKKEAQDIDFIPYEIINNKKKLSILKQFDILKNIFATIVSHRIIAVEDINVESLVSYLIDMKASSNYEIDGIIIHSCENYTRNTSQNPDYAFAFKAMLDDNIIDTEVEFVEWNITKWNVYKPRIKIKPINLCGVTIQYTTGFNAKYIKENQIGKGAIVSVTRSNDVIPYIVKVQKPGIIEFPEKFVWNSTGVDITSVDNDNSTATIKIISSFFSELGVKHVSDATISKMFESGYDTLLKILHASPEDFAKIDGFGDKLAERTVTNIQASLKKSSLNDAISASSCFGFGFGKKKIQKLLVNLPDFYKKEVSQDLLKEIMTIDGFSEKTATQAMNHIGNLQQFITDISPFINKDEKVITSTISNEFLGQTIVFSGFRDKELELWITCHGGIIGTAVSKTTTTVITNDINETSSKLKKARDYKIQILEKKDFEKKFFI